MMKRLMSILLMLCVILTLLPATTLADTNNDANYYDEDVTWLGTTTEYQKTLKGFFDAGLRKVSVGKKYGLVEQSGAFVVQPIYDNIEAYYLHKERSETKSTNQNKKQKAYLLEDILKQHGMEKWDCLI